MISSFESFEWLQTFSMRGQSVEKPLQLLRLIRRWHCWLMLRGSVAGTVRGGEGGEKYPLKTHQLRI